MPERVAFFDCIELSIKKLPRVNETMPKTKNSKSCLEEPMAIKSFFKELENTKITAVIKNAKNNCRIIKEDTEIFFMTRSAKT